MTRRKWLVLAVTAALIVAAAGGYGIWQARDTCNDAVAEADVADTPHITSPDELEPAITDGSATVLDPPAPFGQPRLAVISADRPQLVDNGTLLQTHGSTVSFADSRTGEPAWARRQRGIAYGALPVGDQLVLAQVPTDEALTVVAVDPADGSVRTCTQVGDAVEDPGFGVRQAAGEAVDDRSVAVFQRQPDDQFGLFIVDVREGTVISEQAVELHGVPETVHVAGDSLIVSAIPDDTTDAWAVVNERREQYTAQMLDLHAFSASDGAPIWDYATDHDGGRPFAHQVVGTTDELAVVRASRFDESTETIENHLIALNAATGEPEWSHRLPSSPGGYYAEGRLFGDVIITVEADEESNNPYASMVGYDAIIGDQLWRIANPSTSLERAALLGDTVAVPGKTGRGLTQVDLQTGEAGMVFGGESVGEIIADDTTIGVVFYLADDPTLVLYDRS